MNEPTKTDCRRFESRIAELLGGDSSSAGFVELCVHVRACDDCAQLLDIHSRLQDLSAPSSTVLEDPTAEEWDRVRDAVLAQLDSEPRRSSTTDAATTAALPDSSPAGDLVGDRSGGPRLGRSLEWLAAAALATALLASGWWLGRTAGGAPSAAQVPDSSSRVVAQPTIAVDDSLDGYEIENVRVRDVDGGQVSVSFDLATHVETLRPRTDPLVREAVVRSLWGEADLGGRIEAIEQTGELPLSDTVRDALLHAMLKDPDVAVRLSAQQRLANAELDEHVEPALLQVLRLEESVQMRLLAVDMLAEGRVDPGELVRAVEEGRPEPGNALKLLAANYARRF